MSAPNKGQTFKRLSINLTEELDRSVLELRKREEYVRCSYVELIRILMTEGAKVLGVYPRLFAERDTETGESA